MPPNNIKYLLYLYNCNILSQPIYFVNIFDSGIYLIKNAKIFIGTSLHGLITSISYEIPHMAFTNKIKKEQILWGDLTKEKCSEIVNELVNAKLKNDTNSILNSNKKRIENAAYLNEGLKDVDGIVTPYWAYGSKHVYHQYTIRVEKGDRDDWVDIINDCGVGTGIHYPIPLYNQPIYKKLEVEGDCPNAELAADNVISLPVHPSLSKEDLDIVIERNPFIHMAYYARGFAKKRLGKWEEAISDFNQALVHAPDNSIYIINRIEAYDELERYDEASDILNYNLVMPDIKEGDTIECFIMEEVKRNG